MKCFLDTLGKRFNVHLLGFEHWFMSIIVSQLKDFSISLYQYIYANTIVAKYLYTSTVKKISKFYKINLKSDTVFTKDDVSTSYYQFEKLNREFNIHYRYCIGSLIYLLSTRVDLSFSVHKLAKFSSNPGELNV